LIAVYGQAVKLCPLLPNNTAQPDAKACDEQLAMCRAAALLLQRLLL
jgi:hypothetical protein